MIYPEMLAPPSGTDQHHSLDKLTPGLRGDLCCHWADALELMGEYSTFDEYTDVGVDDFFH